jgi:hypothetical protein
MSIVSNMLVAVAPSGFHIFPDGRGHWCVQNRDCSIAGTFTTREAALRFAKTESASCDAPPIRYEGDVHH